MPNPDAMAERAAEWQEKRAYGGVEMCSSCHSWKSPAMLTPCCMHDLAAFAREEVARKLDECASVFDGNVRETREATAGTIDTRTLHASSALQRAADWLRAEAARVRGGK